METIWNDLKYGARSLAKDRGFTALAVITLALGIGLNTAVFSLVNAVLLKPLPATNPDELVSVWNETKNSILAQEPLAYPDFEDLREQNRSLSALSAYALFPVALDLGGESQMVISQAVSGSYFDMLGARAARGRTFQPEEDRTRGTHPVVVLSDAAWRRRFGARPDVVRQMVRLNGNPFTVIGVAEPQFTGVIRGFTPELWLPMMMIPTLQSEAGLISADDTATSPSDNPRRDRLSSRRSRWFQHRQCKRRRPRAARRAGLAKRRHVAGRTRLLRDARHPHLARPRAGCA